MSIHSCLVVEYLTEFSKWLDMTLSQILYLKKAENKCLYFFVKWCEIFIFINSLLVLFGRRDTLQSYEEMGKFIRSGITLSATIDNFYH